MGWCVFRPVSSIPTYVVDDIVTALKKV